MSPWHGMHIIVYSDNTATVAMVNKGSSRNPVAMEWLRQLFWLSATKNFHITARHIAGVDNIVSDRLSRLDEFHITECLDFLASYGIERIHLRHHMSYETYGFLQNGSHLSKNSTASSSQLMQIPHD